MSQASVTQDHHGTPFPDWSNTSLSRELDALLCACTTQTLPHEFNCNSCDPNLLVVNKPRCNPQQQQNQHKPRSISTSISTRISSRRSSVSDPISPKLTPSLSFCSSPDTSPMVATSPQPTPCFTTELSNHPDLRCRWASCEKVFDTPQDLAAHVNIAHLQLPPPKEGVRTPRLRIRQQPSPEAECTPVQDPNWLSCLWDNCNRFPTPSQVPGPSVGNVFEAAKGFLACHIQQDHLGLLVSRQPIYSEPCEPMRDGQHIFPDKSPHVSTPASNPSAHCRSSPSPLASPRDNQTSIDAGSAPSQHFCRWQSCAHAGVPFDSVADLTVHITKVHVGAGNSRYHCLWEDCNRNGDSGFTSKQKILRHIQVSCVIDTFSLISSDSFCGVC